jgi:hypothetical protein
MRYASKQGRGKWKSALLIPAILVGTSCLGPSSPPNLTTLEPSQDQSAIASYHLHEAAILRNKGHEMAAQALQYERLFGPNSEWAASAHLLAQFYEEAAREQERMAEIHFDSARQSPVSFRKQP